MEQHNSPRHDASADGMTATRVFKGDYETLKAFYDQLINGEVTLDAGGAYWPILNLSVETEGPGAGTLQVVFKLTPTEPGDPTGSDLPGPKRRLVWSFISRDIRRHPLFVDVTRKNLQAIEQALQDNEDPAFEGGAVDPDSDASKYDPKWMLFRKLQRGEESYEIAVPIITLTTVSREEPAAGAEVNRIVKPPPEARPVAGYEYRMTADEVNDEEPAKLLKPTKFYADTSNLAASGNQIIYKTLYGLFTRTREYTGADKWDADLYTRYPTK